jgi:hypothetical protein
MRARIVVISESPLHSWFHTISYVFLFPFSPLFNVVWLRHWVDEYYEMMTLTTILYTNLSFSLLCMIWIRRRDVNTLSDTNGFLQKAGDLDLVSLSNWDCHFRRWTQCSYHLACNLCYLWCVILRCICVWEWERVCVCIHVWMILLHRKCILSWKDYNSRGRRPKMEGGSNRIIIQLETFQFFTTFFRIDSSSASCPAMACKSIIDRRF